MYSFIERSLLKQLRISCLSYEYQTSVTNIHFLSYEYHEFLRIWVTNISTLKTDASFAVFFALMTLLAWVYCVTMQYLFCGPAVGSDILAKYPKTRIFLPYPAVPPPFWIFVTTVTNFRCGTVNMLARSKPFCISPNSNQLYIHIPKHKQEYTHAYIYIYIYTYVCACVYATFVSYLVYSYNNISYLTYRGVAPCYLISTGVSEYVQIIALQ